jgi:hypothetical protein
MLWRIVAEGLSTIVCIIINYFICLAAFNLMFTFKGAQKLKRRVNPRLLKIMLETVKTRIPTLTALTKNKKNLNEERERKNQKLLLNSVKQEVCLSRIIGTDL